MSSLRSERHPSALFSCVLLNSCGISMDCSSSFFLKELHGSRSHHIVMMDFLQMYNKWFTIGNGLTAADSTWQSILH